MAEDLGNDEIRTWNMRWDSASIAEQTWRADGREIIARYRDATSKSRKTAKFNILWSNTETLIPALFVQPPNPDIRRRYRDKDPVAKAVAEVIERSLSFIIDDQDPDFEATMFNVLQDYTLPGRANCRVGYEPTFGEEREDLIVEEVPNAPFTEEDEEIKTRVVTAEGAVLEDNEFRTDDDGVFRMNEVLLDERVVFNYTHWEDIRFGRYTTWPPPWVGYEGGMTKVELKANFPELTAAEIKLIPFDRYENKTRETGKKLVSSTQKRNDMSAPPECTIREIWDRNKGEYVIYAPFMRVGADDEQKILQKGEPPLTLKNFYDIPEPLYAVKTTDSGQPIAEFRMYQDQARSLDTVTQRIDDLVDAMKVRGVYDKSFKEIGNLFRAGNRKLVPVDSYQKMVQAGGLNNGALQMVDLSPFAAAIQSLYVERDQLKNIIFETIGLADIMRGISNPEEALGTQRLKANFGSRRLERRQKDVQRFIRDMYRIAAEIVCEVFELDTIKKMTGLNYPMEAEKQQGAQMIQQFQQAQQMLQQAQQAGQQAQQDPQAQQALMQAAPQLQQAQQVIQQIQPQVEAIQEMLQKPTWEEIHETMKNEATRKFRIDIETDSTLGIDDQREKQVMAEMLSALAQVLQVMGQAEMQGILTREQTNQFLLSVIRKMEGGRAVEDVFDQNDETNKESLLLQQLRQQMGQMQTQLQDKSKELEIKASKVQVDAMRAQSEDQNEKMKALLNTTTQESVADIRKETAITVAQINKAAKAATAASAEATEMVRQFGTSQENQKSRDAEQTSQFQAQAMQALAEALKLQGQPKTITKTDNVFEVE